MSGVLQGQVAIVTGAGRGIGRAIAIAYAEAGARLWLAARNEAELAETAARCREAGAGVVILPTDIADRAAVQGLVEAALAAEGRIDALVNSAGVLGPIGPLAEATLNEMDAWEQALRVNLLGPAYLCRAVLPSMQARGSGRIILIAGGGATQPMPNFSAYAASKAALVRLMDTLAEEVQASGVCVNAIAPGLVDTTLQDAVLAAGERAGTQLAKIQAARQSGAGAVPPTLAAELAVFLASDAATGMTGKLIAAPHDPWREWDGRAPELNGSPLYTLRRLDPFTIRPLIEHPALQAPVPGSAAPPTPDAASLADGGLRPAQARYEGGSRAVTQDSPGGSAARGQSALQPSTGGAPKVERAGGSE